MEAIRMFCAPLSMMMIVSTPVNGSASVGSVLSDGLADGIVELRCCGLSKVVVRV